MLITILLFTLILAVLVISHEFGHFIVAKRNGIRVEEFGFGFPPRIWGKQYGETLYTINLLPLGGFVKVEGEDDDAAGPRSFGAKSIKIRSYVIAAGVIANLIVAWIIFTVIALIGSPVVLTSGDESTAGIQDITVKVISISENSPAAEAGLSFGDTILEARTANDQMKITRIGEIQGFTSRHVGEQIVLTIQRNSAVEEIMLTPREHPPEGEGSIGIAMVETGLQKSSWYSTPLIGLKRLYETAVSIIQVLWSLVLSIFGGPSVAGNLAGPVGIAVIVGETSKLGLVFLLELIALLSVNLAVVNVLPIPALDGGRLFFLIIEKLRGSPVPQRIPRIAHSIGFVILISLLFLITYQDIVRFF